jgi:hypothetical protein
MIWLLSKLFSAQTLAKALSRKSHVYSVDVTTHEDVSRMAEYLSNFHDWNPQPKDGSYHAPGIH